MAKKTLNRIKAVLAENEKSNKWLADNLGVNVNTVSKWCTNKMQPSLESLFEIANLLNIDVRELIATNKKEK